MRTFSLSANIENGFAEGSHYIVTSNAKRAVYNIINDFHSGIHSFTIIGSYGTGKSSFLLALESDLKAKSQRNYLLEPKNLSPLGKFEFLNIVGDYTELSTLLRRHLNVEGDSVNVLDALNDYYKICQRKKKFLVIVIDEFGKLLEHASKNNPEKELYFLQKFAEYVNASGRDILLLTTLHQNFSAYAKDLTESQANEWVKVKGRFKEITFVEPIEQLLALASEQLQVEKQSKSSQNAKTLFDLAKDINFISEDFPWETAQALYPLDVFSAVSVTSAIQRYGQNERSLFSFLAAKGSNSIAEFSYNEHQTYNMQRVYDYVLYSFYSYLKDANADSMTWNSIQVAIERVEGHTWDSKEEMLQAVNMVKAIGLLNLYGNAGFRLTATHLALYANLAMNIPNAAEIIKKLEVKKIVRFATYKERIVLFEGTDIDLEAAIRDAGAVVARSSSIVDELNLFFNKRIAPVKAHYFHKGTPRFFDYMIREEPLDVNASGDIDGYIELIFYTKKDALKELKEFSSSLEQPIIFAFFTNAEDIAEHLFNIRKYHYLLEHVIDSSDRVATTEIQRLLDFEEALLNKAVSDNLFAYKNRVIWIFDGKEEKVSSHRDFNKLLSKVCNTIYHQTPVMINELFNKHKLSSAISAARKSYMTALVDHSTEEDLGFPKDKFPPEKTIYFSLLKNTGLYLKGEFAEAPSNKGFMPLWNACENFLKSSENKARKISELIKILTTKPYKLKQGFIDFWVPTYLYIRRQDFALYDSSRGAYMPEVNMEFFDLLQKHPGDFEIKKFTVDGVKLGFFNQYRRFVNLGDEFAITNDNFIETIKPFLYFYRHLNEYTQNTQKFDHQSTMRFRDVLAQAKDPEKAFFEDLPAALGFDQAQLKQEEFIEQYGKVIQRAIKELRNCYSSLIDRLEAKLVEELGLDSYDYDDYIVQLKQRLANVKSFLLTDKQREFYQHAMAEYENRTYWFQSVCYSVLGQRLDSIRDEQESKLAEDLVYLFRECEKYADISKNTEANSADGAYSFDMVTNDGVNLRTQTYILPEKDKRRASELEERINKMLTGDSNLDICTLLEILKKKTNQ